jgi:hypothetical protein
MGQRGRIERTRNLIRPSEYLRLCPPQSIVDFAPKINRCRKETFRIAPPPLHLSQVSGSYEEESCSIESYFSDKQHAHVLRGIRKMLDELIAAGQLDEGLSNVGSSYLNAQGKEQPCYELPPTGKDLTRQVRHGARLRGLLDANTSLIRKSS